MTSLCNINQSLVSEISAKLSHFEKGFFDSMVSSSDVELIKIIELDDDDSSDKTELILNLILERSTDTASRDWNSVFTGMSAQDAKRMAKEGKEMLSSDSRSLTYGEVITVCLV